MILVDWIGHMTSDVGADELHVFAKRLGLKRMWYQMPGYGEENAHYDLTTYRMRAKAQRMGAVLVTSKELVKRAWWREAYLRRRAEELHWKEEATDAEELK